VSSWLERRAEVIHAMADVLDEERGLGHDSYQACRRIVDWLDEKGWLLEQIDLGQDELPWWKAEDSDDPDDDGEGPTVRTLELPPEGPL